MSTRITDEYLRKIIRTLKKSAARHRSEIRPGKRRFGIYKYLTDVYQVFLEFNSTRKAKTATRRIAKISKLSIQRKSHPIRALIEASAGPEDARQKSRWAQALKYAYGWRQSAERLEWFFETNGGIAGSARKFAVTNKTARQRNDGGQNNIIHRQRGLGEIPKLNVAASEILKPRE
jgi:hypothetical protein